MTTISIPRSLEGVTNRLGALGDLIRVREWEKAALIAAFVRLSPGKGQRNTGTGISPVQFTELGLNGLRSPSTVVLYVQRWLDAHDGIYPEPGAKVTIPDLDWPPEDGNIGSRVAADPVKAIEQVIQKHGVGAFADAVTEIPHVDTAVSRARLNKVSTPKGRKDLVDRSRRSEEALEEAVRASHEGLADHTHHEVELELMSVESSLRRAVAKMEQYPFVSDSQRQRLAAAFERIELFLGILRKGSSGITQADRDFLDTVGIES